MRPSVTTALALLLTTPALALAQSAPVCLESPGPEDAAYSARPIATNGCVQPARYDVSLVGGCVGVYGASSLSLRDGLVTATGPDWKATIDVSVLDPVVTPDCAGAKPAALTPVSPLETTSVAARAKLLSDPRPDVRAAALEATARDQANPAACDALSAFLRDAPSYGFAREADAKRALSLSQHGCLNAAASELAGTPERSDAATAAASRTNPSASADLPPAPTEEPSGAPSTVAPLLDPQGDSAEDSAAYSPEPPPTYDAPTPEASVTSTEDAPGGTNEPGGMGYSFNIGMLVGDPTLGPDPVVTMWGGLKLFPEDEEWGSFFAPGIQFTLANTRVEVVPTVRVGMAYALTGELDGGPDALARTFTAIEGYAILGIKPTIGSGDAGIRVGVGVASPLGLIVSIATLGELGFPLPNGIEFFVDQDLVSSNRVARLNLTWGF